MQTSYQQLQEQTQSTFLQRNGGYIACALISSGAIIITLVYTGVIDYITEQIKQF